MNRKIYIMGPVGSGKTTFSKQLSKKYGIQYYELDKVSWDDAHGHVKRSEDEAMKIFHEILGEKSWIIEDVGRTKFQEGRKEADIIYYIKLSRLKAYYRVIKRWLKQRLGKEVYNHPPTGKQLLYFISTVNSYYKKEPERLKDLEEYKDKVIYITNKDMKKILKKEITPNE